MPAEKLAQTKRGAREGADSARRRAGCSQACGLSEVAELAKRLVGRPSRAGVQIGGVDDVLVRFGRCCNPVPGDPIVGFITRGRGVTVHTAGCEKALATDPERRVDVAWDVRATSSGRSPCGCSPPTGPGLLADISQTFSKKGVNISQANCRATGDDRAVNTFEVTISDLKQLTDLMRTPSSGCRACTPSSGSESAPAACEQAIHSDPGAQGDRPVLPGGALRPRGAGWCSSPARFPSTRRPSELVPGDVAAQTERVMQNLKAVLAAAGGLDFSHVVRCSIFLADLADFAKVNEVYGRYFPGASAGARHRAGERAAQGRPGGDRRHRGARRVGRNANPNPAVMIGFWGLG